MSLPLLYEIPLWLDAVLFAAVLFGCFEVSYRVGSWRRRTGKARDQDRRGDVILNAMLGFLGLMLAFTYGFTISRSEHRKAAVLEEVNAIGTAFNRAELLKEPYRSDLRHILLDYTRTRVATEAKARNSATIREMIDRSTKEQARIWPVVRKMIEGTASPGPLEVSVVQSINDVLDAHTTRFTSAYDVLPSAILFMLLFVSGASLAVGGYSDGRADTLRRWRVTVLILVLTSILVVIVDFDRSLDGFIQTSQQGYIVLIDDMEQALGETGGPASRP